GEGAVRDLRRSFRPGAARRGGRPRGSPADAVLHRFRPAAARGDPRRPGADYRRQNLVSAGPGGADAGILGSASLIKLIAALLGLLPVQQVVFTTRQRPQTAATQEAIRQIAQPLGAEPFDVLEAE